MDNKGHFHFELSFKGHVNKKSTASTPVLGIAVACLLLPRIRQILGSGWPQSGLRDLSQHLVLVKASERFRTKGTHLPQEYSKGPAKRGTFTAKRPVESITYDMMNDELIILKLLNQRSSQMSDAAENRGGDSRTSGAQL